MKFVEQFKKEDFVKPSETSMVDRTGQDIQDEKKAFAKSVVIDLGDTNQIKYFVRTHNNVPYDPNGPYSHRETYLRTELKNVSKETFESYVTYLKTRNKLYMTKAQRSFING
jgi:signal peptidase I